MTQTSKSLEDKISGLLASLAVTNEGLMRLTQITEKHDAILYGTDDRGGLVSRGNTNRQILETHEETLERLESSCQQVVSFMETQLEVNRNQSNAMQNLNKVIYALSATVVLILILIGIADINALHNLLGGIKLP